MWPVVVGIVIMFGAFLTGRVMRERSLRLLTPDQKVRLVDSFAASRIVHSAVASGIALVFIGALLSGVASRFTVFAVLLVAWCAFLSWTHLSVARRLRHLELPAAYVQGFHRARLVSYAGLGVLVVSVLFAVRD